MAITANKPILVIGGGLMGLSIAHELAQKGQDVEVLSRKRSEAAGFVAAGMLAPHSEGLEGKLLKLGLISLKIIPKWIKEIEKNSGLNCGLKKCGIIVPFLDSKTRDQLPTAKLGKYLNRHELEKEVPGLSKKWNTGILFEQDGQIDNRRKLMRALEKACVELGVQFQEGVEVQGLINEGGRFHGLNIINAQGEKKVLKANQAVLCSGAWSKQILEEIPVFPVKGQLLSMQGPKNSLKRIIFGPGTYLVPREDGLIIAGATSEKHAGFTEGLTPSGQNQLHEGITSLLPDANKWPQMERWWGFRPCTPDEGPLLGESSSKGLWLATGHYRNGVLLAAITALLLSKCICKEHLNDTEENLLQTFNWQRFKG